MYDPNKECQRLIVHIQELCRAHGWSNYAFARKANISTSTVHGIMCNRTMPQIYTLLQICNAFEISISEIFLENPAEKEQSSNSEECLPQEEIRLLDRYRRLSAKQRKWLWLSLEILTGK